MPTVAELRVRTWGREEAPVAVLVHGVSASSLTFWRVGPWFAEHGWRAVAVDLRGHGESPRLAGDEGLPDLAADVQETIAGVVGEATGVDVLLGHSLGALTAMTLVAAEPGFARRVVLEDPPGLGSVDPSDVAAGIEANVAAARADPEGTKRGLLVEHPSWAEEDAANTVTGRLRCDVGPVARMIRELRWDLVGLAASVPVPALAILAGEGSGSMLRGEERAAVVRALRHGTARSLEGAGHNVHRDDFAGYVRVLGEWLQPAA